jgi:predicted DNA binding protein
MPLIYAHFPADKKSSYHKILTTYLRSGGIVILKLLVKASRLQQQNEKVGGPQDLDTLFSIDEIKSDFQNFEELEEKRNSTERRTISQRSRDGNPLCWTKNNRTTLKLAYFLYQHDKKNVLNFDIRL